MSVLSRLFILLCSLLAWGQVLASEAQWHGAAFEGDRQALAQLAAAGAKVVRVYREADAWVLDEAQRLGLQVVMGLWVGLPHRGFRLEDPAARARQEAGIRAFVSRYKDHPALLAWGVGNEVELGLSDPLPVWREVNRLAGIVKALDPGHPTVMVATDGDLAHLRRLAACCDQVDMLGLNLYAGSVFDLPQRLREAGVGKPVIIAEMGPLGQWQAGQKPWGAPVELTSSAKALWYREALAFLARQPEIRGAFPFLWGAKYEQTGTWHGLLLADGSLTPMTDALATAWGNPPPLPAPEIRGIGIAADVFAPGQEISAGLDAHSTVGLPLQAEWQLLPEARHGEELSAAQAPLPVAVSWLQADSRGARLLAPRQPGAYRLFVTLRDSQGKAATANLPLLVR